MNGAIWIKLLTGLFDDEKIKLLEGREDGDGIVLLWIKLLCLAGKQNYGGKFLLGGEVPMTEKDFSIVFSRPLSFIKRGFKLFEKYKMLSCEDGVYALINWERYQQLTPYEKKKERDRLYQQKRRNALKERETEEVAEDDIFVATEGKTPLSEICYDEEVGEVYDNRLLSDDASHDVVTQRREEKEKRREDTEDTLKGDDAPFGEREFSEEVYSRFPFVPKLMSFTEKRRASVRHLIKVFGKEEIFAAFDKIDRSPFLRGEGSSRWVMTFDWLIKEENFRKIAEGAYLSEPPKASFKPSERREKLEELKASVNDSLSIIKADLAAAELGDEGGKT